MRPLKLIIEGDFWDSQIYSGKLYLWDMDGDLITIDWDKYVSYLMEKFGNEFAIESALRDSRSLIENHHSALLKDTKIKNVILSQFEKLGELEISSNLDQLADFIIVKQSNPFKELPTDSDIHNNKLFAALDSGLWSSNINRKNKNRISSKPSKLWDCPLLSISAKSLNIALSAGDDGLFQIDLRDNFSEEQRYQNLKEVERNIFQISNKHSLYSNWAFTSIYSSSYNNKSYMAAFGWERPEEDEDEGDFDWDLLEDYVGKSQLGKKSIQKNYGFKRVFKEIINEKSIFDDSQSVISWATDKLIFRAKNDGIEIAKYIQSHVEDEEFFFKADNEKYYRGFTKSEFIPFAPWKGDIIAGAVSHFGTIIECENALVILQENGSFYNIEGAITRWRYFSKSKNYQTHLHAILDNRIELYSFISDTFFDKTITPKFNI